MTGAEALTKWCPLSRVNLGSVTVNRNPVNGNPRGQCVGSDCALWQWDTSPELVKHMKEHGNPAPTLIEDGHCGLING